MRVRAWLKSRYAGSASLRALVGAGMAVVVACCAVGAVYGVVRLLAWMPWAVVGRAFDSAAALHPWLLATGFVALGLIPAFAVMKAVEGKEVSGPVALLLVWCLLVFCVAGPTVVAVESHRMNLRGTLAVVPSTFDRLVATAVLGGSARPVAVVRALESVAYRPLSDVRVGYSATQNGVLATLSGLTRGQCLDLLAAAGKTQRAGGSKVVWVNGAEAAPFDCGGAGNTVVLQSGRLR